MQILAYFMDCSSNNSLLLRAIAMLVRSALFICCHGSYLYLLMLSEGMESVSLGQAARCASLQNWEAMWVLKEDSWDCDDEDASQNRGLL